MSIRAEEAFSMLRERQCTSMLHLELLMVMYKDSLGSTSVKRMVALTGQRQGTISNALCKMKRLRDPLVCNLTSADNRWGRYFLTKKGRAIMTAVFMRFSESPVYLCKAFAGDISYTDHSA